MRVSARLEKATREIYKLANDKANTEQAYRKALAEEITTLRASGLPVTVVSDVARGNVSELKFKRDLAESMYDSAILSMKALQTTCSVLQTVSRYQAEVEK